MRLKAVTLRSYRMHEELRVEFDPARTVLGGPNESGKSTLVEAIHRAFFFRHRSAVDLESIRPRQLSAAPEVIVEFTRRGHEYELHKVFKGPQGSVAKLTDHTTGDQFTGDEADDRLRDLLGVDEVHPTKFKGQWSHLWVWQGTATADPTSADVASDSAKRLRLKLAGGPGRGLGESEHDSATYAKVVAAHAETYGAKGVVLKSSELFAARADVDAARQAAADAAATLRDLEQAADAILREEATLAGCSELLDEAKRAIARTDAVLSRIEEVERQLEHEKRELKAAEDAYATLAQGNAEIRSLDDAIATLRTSIAPQETDLATLAGHEKRSQEAETQAATTLAQAAAEERASMTEQDFFDSIGRAFALAARRMQLEKTLGQIAAREAEIGRLDGQLRELPAIDEKQADELADLERRLGVAQATLDAIATRIEVRSAAETIMIGEERLEAGDEKTLTDAAELSIGLGTTIRVTPGGGKTLADVRRNVAEIEQQLASKLAALGVASAAAAREALENRSTADSLRRQLAATVAELGGDELKAELAQTLSAIEAADAEIARKLPTGHDRPTDAAEIATAREQAVRRHADATKAFQDAQDGFNVARRAAADATKRRQEAEAAMTTSREELQRLGIRKLALESHHGIDREVRLCERAAAKKQAEETVAGLEQSLASLNPSQARADRERLARTIELTEKKAAEARERQATARGRLQQAGTTDLHAAKASADARLELAERRLAEVDRRSRAIDLLRKLFDERRQAVAEQLAAPLREKVAEYLDALCGGGSRVEVSLTNDGLAGLKVSRPTAGGGAFDFGSLSGGTKEQVAAACRLAMAELLADGDACLPIVFDDAFTNSDPERIHAVQRVLDLGARRGLQIIVLSCNPQDYGLLGAKAIDLTPPARSAG